MSAADAITTEAAEILRQGHKRMFDVRLTNLFKAGVICSSSTHSVEILRDHWMVIVRRGKPVEVDRSQVAGISADGESHLGPACCVRLRQPTEIPNDHIGPGNASN